MSSFTISPTLNKDRVFLLLKSELEKRLDPQFYRQDFKDNIAKIKKVKHKRLGEVVKFSTEIWNQKDFFNSTFPYIEISEIDTLSGEIQNISQVEIEKAPSRAKMVVRENDIIISTTRPNRGAISFIKQLNDFSIASTGFSVIRDITNSEINREYLFAVIRQQIILKQFEQRSSGGNYPAITQEELNNVVIPIPEINKQEKIIAIFKTCFEQKKQKEAQAEKLLSSIDDYLLKELGITLPTKPENILKNRMFFSSLKNISGDRFDPYYHQDIFKKLDKIFSTSLFKRFSKLIDIITKGETPLWKGESYVADGIPFLKVQNISIDGIFGELTYITKALHDCMFRSKLFGGELLYTMAGSIGIATYLPNDFGEANINQAIAKIVLSSHHEFNRIYLMEVLNSTICKIQARRFLTVAAQPNINFEQIKAIRIPLPPLANQKEIAEHITDIRKQAQQLKDKTKEELKKASEEIEKILLT